jgi:hypothetical protein
VLILSRLFDKSAEYVVAVFPCTVLNDETGKIELTEFQRVPPSPFAINM